jgi:hypothetical protein
MADCLIYAADILSDHIGDSDRQLRKPVRALSTIFAAVKDSRHEYRIRLDPILDDMAVRPKRTTNSRHPFLLPSRPRSENSPSESTA